MRKINTDLLVGLFLITGFLCFVYLSMRLGEFSPFFAAGNSYSLVADFDNISGLKEGAVVEIAGVKIGKVARIGLGKYDRASVVLLIDKGVKIGDDAIASIRTRGIIGDKYIRIIPGGSEDFLEDGGRMTETESGVDLEELVSKYIFGGVK